MSSHPFDKPDFHVVTDCGELSCGYTYQGFYGFNFSFGACQIFIYRLRTKYQVVSRSWCPVDKHGSWQIVRLSAVGYVLHETKLFSSAIRAYLIFVNRFLTDASPHYCPDDIALFDVPLWSTDRSDHALPHARNKD